VLHTPAGTDRCSRNSHWRAAHSVRGFLAGVVREKLGLNLVSEIGDKGRVYRIRDGKASLAALDRSKQAS